jgi:transglutaminase-like putative cysteine protease
MRHLAGTLCNSVVFVLLAAGAVQVLGQTAAIDIAWLPVTDAERNMKAPVVEKGAGVEALFWRVHVRDEVLGGRDLERVYYHYVRLKVFDEKGKEKASTIDLPFDDRTSIMYVVGRTIKADGTEIELKKDSVYDRDLIRAGRTKLRVKSFAMPGVEPGAIVEYRWREISHDPRSLYMRVQFQREFPVQKVTYFFAPLSREYTEYRMAIRPFHCVLPPLQDDRDGFQSITLENQPAFHDEPMMPGEPNVRAWALVFYSNGERREPEKYWANVGKEQYNRYLKPAMKANNEIKDVAATAVSDAKTDEEKVLALIQYIRKNLRDLFGSQVTDVERAQIIKDMPKDRYRTAAEILKSGVGDSSELNTFFAAMANSVGLEVRPALIADRENIVFIPAMTDQYFLENVDMAVNIGGNWKIYDVSARDLPSNMLSWREEGMQALLSDPKKPTFVAAPIARPEASARVRKAKFALADDGSIDGDIDLQYSGHSAHDRRSELKADSDARRLELYKDQLTKLYPDGEITDVRIENASDPEKPLTLHYHLKMTGYAQRTGKRILFQPFFFQRGVPPVFSASERKYPVYFPYAWQEHDSVTFEFPPGFALDNAESPGSLNFGAPGAYKIQMMTKGAHELITDREFTFGNNGQILFETDAYPQLKKIFDEVQRRDDHTISLKQVATAEAK